MQTERICGSRGRVLNTPAHILLGAATFGRAGPKRVLFAAMAGGLAPDLSLYILAGTSLFLLQIPPQVVFDELYFSTQWQTIFAIDNSIFLWLALLGAAFWQGATRWMAFAGAGLLHVCLDFPLHAGDGRAHFWPVTNWVFHSPLSYWDSAHHASVVVPIGVVLCFAALIALLIRRHGTAVSVLFVALFAAELWVARQWLVFF